MKPQPMADRYVVAPGLTWVVTYHGVLVLDEYARRTVELPYPEAAIWELAAMGRDMAAIADRLRLVAAIAAEEAQQRVAECVARWRAAGWLVGAGEA